MIKTNDIDAMIRQLDQTADELRDLAADEDLDLYNIIKTIEHAADMLETMRLDSHTISA